MVSIPEPSPVIYFAGCAVCGAVTFIDLLDDKMRCEYCREVESTSITGKKGRARKKAKAGKAALNCGPAPDTSSEPH